MNLPDISYSLKDVSVTGFWFCSRCQRITERVEDLNSGLGRCKMCGYTGIKYHPPVFPESQCNSAQSI